MFNHFLPLELLIFAAIFGEAFGETLGEIFDEGDFFFDDAFGTEGFNESQVFVGFWTSYCFL